SSLTAILAAGSLTDSDAQVRLAALLTLADMPASDVAGTALVAAISVPANREDRWIPDAATSAAARHDLPFLQALARRSSSEAVPAKLTEIAARVAEHHARGNAAHTVGSLLASMVNASPPVADAVVLGLARGWPKDQKADLDDRTEKAMAQL